MVERAHSIFAPSSAYRWTKCPGSIKLSEKAPPQTPHPTAIQGTDAHWLAEQILNQPVGNRAKAKDYTRQLLPSGARVNRSMAYGVQQYIDYIEKHHRLNGGNLYVETRVEMPKIDPRMFGSSDVVQVTNRGQLHIFDLKFGVWAVDAEYNQQLMLYALGALSKFKTRLDLSKPVTAHICQPFRNSDHDKAFNSSQFSIESLIKFGNHVKEAIKLADKKDPPLADGDHCRFCPAEFICPKLNQFGRKIWA